MFSPKVQFRLTMPLAIARQYEKHRIGAVRGYEIYDHNEISRRYVDEAPTFFRPIWRARPVRSVKQGSGEEFCAENQAILNEIYEKALDTCISAYQALLEAGVAPEQARFVLPEATETSFIETGSLYFYANLCKLRLDSHAQKEIQTLAQQIDSHMASLFPISWRALREEV